MGLKPSAQPFPRKLKASPPSPPLPSPPLPAAGGRLPLLQRILPCLTEGLASGLQAGLCPRLQDKRAKRQDRDEAAEARGEHRVKPLGLAGETWS